MDQQNTYSRITDQLDALSAPPGETIAERIKGLHAELTEAAARAVLEERAKGEAALADALRTVDAAWAALNAADLFVAEGTLATGIEGLARRRDDALTCASVAEQKLESTHRALRDERERGMSVMVANREMLVDLATLRAEVSRLGAQRDFAAEQIQAAIRASAAPLGEDDIERMRRGA